MRKFMMAALPYVVVVLLGATAGSFYWWINFFEPAPQDVFFDSFPELEELDYLPKIDKEYEYTLALFYTDLSGECGSVGVMKELLKNCPENLRIVLVVDSTYKKQDVENARVIAGIKCEIEVADAKISEKWLKLAKNCDPENKYNFQSYFDGVGFLAESRSNNRNYERVILSDSNELISLLSKL